MANIKINRKNNTIEITKAFEKASSRFGSEEYNMLREARLDNPNFRVIIRTTKQKRETNKGLTYAYMESYIEQHDDENKTFMAEFKMLRGLDDDLAESFSYNEIKAWFFSTFPEIADFHKKREAIMNKVYGNKNLPAVA